MIKMFTLTGLNFGTNIVCCGAFVCFCSKTRSLLTVDAIVAINHTTFALIRPPAPSAGGGLSRESTNPQEERPQREITTSGP